MTSEKKKFVTSKGAGRCDKWHYDPDCNIFHSDSQEVSEATIEWHELEPCPLCTDLVSREKPSEPNLQYQRVEQ